MPAFPLMFQDSLEKNLNLIFCDHEIKGKSTGTPISSHAESFLGEENILVSSPLLPK